jgi:hypothetical protein
MSNDIFQRISIPKPCHEDWGKMTPDEKGAFCKVCNKSVHDFSRKSAEEVEQILLKEEPGKVCGRFSKDQISVPENLEIPFHLLPRNISPFRAFALAVFLVFGTALFGITNINGQNIAGKVCYRPVKPDTTHREKSDKMTKGDVAYIPETPAVPVRELSVQGGLKISKPAVPAKPEEIVPVTRTQELKGEVMVVPDSSEKVRTIEIPEVTKNIPMPTGTVVWTRIESIPPAAGPEQIVDHRVDSVRPTLSVPAQLVTGERVPEGVITPESQLFITGDTVVSEDKPQAIQDGPVTVPFTIGMLVMLPVTDPAPDSVILVTEPVQPKDEPSDSSTSKVSGIDSEVPFIQMKDTPPAVTCFPNPSAGMVTLSYELKERTDADAAIYDVQGNLIRQVFEIKDHYTGIYRQQIDLSGLSNGIYLIRVRIGGKLTTNRVVLNK